MATSALATAFVNIVPGTKDIDSYLKNKLGDNAQQAGEDGGKKLGAGMSSGFKGAIAGLGAAVAAIGIGQFAGDMIRSAEEGQKVDATLANIAKSMGVFGYQTDAVVARIQRLATEQMKLTGVDDDVIKAAQAKLLTFAEVAESADRMGGSFDQATKLSLDLAAAGFGSVDSAAVMLGKALNDPVGGVTALRRVGVQLTDQQKEQIEAFVAAGDAASAQAVILAEVERQVGGTAEASATASEKLKAGWDDAVQTLGTNLLPAFEQVVNFLTAYVVPAVEGIPSAFEKTKAWLESNSGWLIPLTAGLSAVVIGVTAVGTAMKIQAAGGIVAYALAMLPAIASTWAFTAALLANPITWIVVGIGLLIGAIVALAMNWDTVTAFVADVWEGFLGFLEDSFTNISNWWNDLWSGVSQFFSETWNGIVSFFEAALNLILQWFLNWTIYGIIIKNWGAIVAFFSDSWNNITRFFQTALGVVGSAFTNTFAAIGNFIRDTFENIVAFVKAPINAIIGLINNMIGSINKIKVDIPSWVPGLGGKTLGFNIAKIPALADGGYVTSPTMALIGEAGPEVVTPLRDFERMMGVGNGSGQTINYYAAPNESIDSERALLNAMQRAKVLTAW